MLTAAAADFAPHDVTFYLRDLAAAYHSYYDAERILVDDVAVKQARLARIAATAQVLHNGLAVLGVSALPVSTGFARPVPGGHNARVLPNCSPPKAA